MSESASVAPHAENIGVAPRDPLTPYRHLARAVLESALYDLIYAKQKMPRYQTAVEFFHSEPLVCWWCLLAELDPAPIIKKAHEVLGELL